VIRHDFPQYSPEWWDARCGVPTASEFSRIVTPAKGDYSKGAEGYIAELIAEQADPHYGEVETYVSAAMRNGTMMEPEARRFYEFERGADVEEVGFCLTDDGRFGCSPDGLVGDDGGLELKSPEHKTHVKYLLSGEVPTEYKPQVHAQLIITGREWCDFMSYARGLPPLLVRVEPDDYTAKVRAAMDTFWGEYQEALGKIRALGGLPVIEHAETTDEILF
jgi:hypothetical protein